MRRPSPFTQRRGDLDVTMTPMIDVIFLLLVFFVWTASFQVVENILPSTLSAATGTQASPRDQPPPPEDDFDRVVVRMEQAGDTTRWRINDIPLATPAEVRQRLTVIARIKPDAPVILHPEPGVPLGRVIDVYDQARGVGFQKVQFATSREI